MKISKISFPLLKIDFKPLGTNENYFVKEVGEIIPFPVWMISFPVLKIDFELLGSNEKHFVKEVF